MTARVYDNAQTTHPIRKSGITSKTQATLLFVTQGDVTGTLADEIKSLALEFNVGVVPQMVLAKHYGFLHYDFTFNRRVCVFVVL